MSADVPMPCVWHNPDQRGYVAQSKAADARMAAGQKQRRCGVCRLYFWPDEWGEPE